MYAAQDDALIFQGRVFGAEAFIKLANLRRHPSLAASLHTEVSCKLFDMPLCLHLPCMRALGTVWLPRCSCQADAQSIAEPRM